MRRAVFLGTVLAAFCSAQAARAQTEPATVDALREILELLTRRVQEMESVHETDRGRIRELEGAPSGPIDLNQNVPDHRVESTRESSGRTLKVGLIGR